MSQAGKPPRPLRIRLELDPRRGKQWLGLLALCGWLKGVVLPEALEPAPETMRTRDRWLPCGTVERTIETDTSRAIGQPA